MIKLFFVMILMLGVFMVNTPILADSVNKNWVNIWSSMLVEGWDDEDLATRCDPLDPSTCKFYHLTWRDGFTNQTIRIIVRPTVDGSELRLKLSNIFRDEPLVIGDIRIAKRDSGAAIVPGTSQVVTFFDGQTSFSIPQNSEAYSDSIVLPFTYNAGDDLAVSIYFPQATHKPMWRGGGPNDHGVNTMAYVSRDPYLGDRTADIDMSVGSPELLVGSWYFLTGIDMKVNPIDPKVRSTVVTTGSSIGQADNATDGHNGGWPRRLATKLYNAYNGKVALSDMVKGGTRILDDEEVSLFGTVLETKGGQGQSLLARFNRDILGVTGVTHVVIGESNDILYTVVLQNPATGDEVITGLKILSRQAKEKGIKVICATLTPFSGFAGGLVWSPYIEAQRQTVNDFIRNQSADYCDSIADFDAAIRDPNQPDQIDPMYNLDGLHPNDAGEQAMADSFDLGIFLPN